MRRTGQQRGGFTLIEMMIAIAIFSLITIYLYSMLGTLRHSTAAHQSHLDDAAFRSKVLKTLFLDLALSDVNQTTITNEDPRTDVIMARTSHSVHRRVMPYVGYLVRDRTLYRFESYTPAELPLALTDTMVVDRLLPVETFRLYRNKSHYLLDLKLPERDEQLLKIPILNQK